MDSNYYFLATTCLTVLGSVWTLAWWLSAKFSEVRNLVYSRTDSLQKMFTDKLEYHERHDDVRFSELSKDIWSVRLQNAIQDKLIKENLDTVAS